jgi:hypothetical protein
MAKYVGRTLEFSTGKQIRLFGNCVAIDKSLRIGEGYALGILSGKIDQDGQRRVFNPHVLSSGELVDLADLNIRLWEKLKANIEKYGLDNPKIFNSRPSSKRTSSRQLT